MLKFRGPPAQSGVEIPGRARCDRMVRDQEARCEDSQDTPTSHRGSGGTFSNSTNQTTTMRPTEVYYSTARLARSKQRRAAARRALWVETVKGLAVFAVMVLLLLWLLSLVQSYKVHVPSSLFQGRGVPGLAMVPVTEGAVLTVLFAGLAGLMVAAVRKVRETDRFCNALRERRVLELEDPFAAVTDGLTGDEMHRILVSVAAEAREIQRVVRLAHPCNDLSDTLAVASRKLTFLIHCVEALCARLQPVLNEDETVVFNQGGRP